MRYAIAVALVILSAGGASAELYTWKDASGTAHYTNQLDSVPMKYRKKVKTIQMPGDQKQDQAQPGATATPPARGVLPMPPPPPAPTAAPSPAPTPAATPPAAPPPAAISSPTPSDADVSTGERSSRSQRRARRSRDE